MRKITKAYADPLDLVWTCAAAQMGIRIVRSAEVNASWNGAGVLAIGTPETLDPDDSLAQMILHEVCHAFVHGQARNGDRHVYASRTRFIPDHIVGHFERVAWPPAPLPAGRSPQPGVRLDLKGRMRGMWT